VPLAPGLELLLHACSRVIRILTAPRQEVTQIQM
jgi:hypothetical protein